MRDVYDGKMLSFETVSENEKTCGFDQRGSHVRRPCVPTLSEGKCVRPEGVEPSRAF